MSKKILFITTSRADYGQSKILIRLFKKKYFKNFYFLVTGSHLSRKDGYTLNEIKNDGISIDFKIDILYKNKKYLNTAPKIASNTFAKFTDIKDSSRFNYYNIFTSAYWNYKYRFFKS